MINQLFKKWMIWALGLSLLFIVTQYFVPFISEYIELSALAIGLFIIINLVMFFLAKGTLEHKNKNLFSSVIFAGTMIKIFLSIITIFGYYHWYEPDSKWFIVPFFIIYFIFTLFETLFLVQINLNGKK